MMVKQQRPLTQAIALIASFLVAACGASRSSEVTASLGSGAPSTSAPRSSPSTGPSSSPGALELPARKRLTDLISAWRSRNDVPGVIVATRLGNSEPLIVADGEDAESGAPLPSDGAFDVASITKTFTGALALDLVDAGMLGLDDSVDKYVNGFANGDRITIRHLLTHTSGLYPQWGEVGDTPYGEEMGDLVISDLEHEFTPEEVLGLVEDRPLEFSPGQGVRYSNINTILLGEVIETATGADIGTAYRERLLDPLGLQDTYYRVTEEGPRPLPGLFSTEDREPMSSAGVPDRALLTFSAPGWGMITTPEDLLDWSVAFLRDGARGREDLSLSRFQVSPTTGTGLGVIPWSSQHGACVFTTFGYAQDACGPFDAVTGVGNALGTSSMVAYFPRWDLTVVAIKNTGVGMPPEVEDLMFEIMRSAIEGQ
jgi:D-alanyl-D-alanine carboxypeptidase